VTKADFQKLAEMRIKEAGILLAAGEFDGAYYLAGYGIECALKACIITMLQHSDSWPEQNFSKQCWTHDLNVLAKNAGLENALKNAGAVTVNWQLVKDWTEESRYKHGGDPLVVNQFHQAITDPNDGVLQWLKVRW
jgi:hypothetical protein